jgi:hypothetical protein
MKKFYLFFSLFIVLTSCEKEDSQLESPILETIKETKTNKISFQKLSGEIKNYIENTDPSKLSRSKGQTQMPLFGEILTDSVVTTKDSLNNQLFSLNISHEDKRQVYFDNFIVSSKPQEKLTSYFIRYIPDEQWWLKHLSFSHLANFTGRVQYFDENGVNFKEAFVTNGEGVLKSSTSSRRVNSQLVTIIIFREEPCGHPWHQAAHSASGSCSHPTTTSDSYSFYVDNSPSTGGTTDPYDPNLNGGGGGTTVPVITATTVEIKALLASELEYLLELTPEQYNSIKNLPIPKLQKVLTYVNESGLTQEAKEFGELAVEACVNYGEVDFEEQVILDKSFIDNDCLYGVYEAMGKATKFKEYLQNFDDNFTNPVANLRLTTGVHPVFPNATAVTDPPENYLIKIMFNPNQLNRPSLDVARTFIHEMIHAEMYRLLLSKAQQGEIPWGKQFIESLVNDYPGLYDYYMRYYYDMPNGIPLGDPQHELMAQHYRNIIENTLREYDNSFSNDVYEALAWVGLKGKGNLDPSTGLTPTSTKAWESVPLSKRLSLNQAYEDFKNQEPNCQ